LIKVQSRIPPVRRPAQHEIEEVAERDDLAVEERQSISADNAKRFFRL
jgi:hypothetical protein